MASLRLLLSAQARLSVRIRRPTIPLPTVSRREQQVRWNSSASPQPLCPSCSRPLPSNLPACPSCWSIFPLPANMSHHKVFGLPDEPNPFLVDLPTLKARFRKAQAACHPDAWASKAPKQQDLAHTLSSRLNEAYQTLLNPLARAEYILEQHGHPMSEQDQVADMEFMAEIMEARELIEETGQEDVAAVQELVENNQENMQKSIADLTTLIEQKNWPESKACAIRLRYQQGIDRAAKKWMDNIG